MTQAGPGLGLDNFNQDEGLVPMGEEGDGETDDLNKDLSKGPLIPSSINFLHWSAVIRKHLKAALKMLDVAAKYGEATKEDETELPGLSDDAEIIPMSAETDDLEFSNEV